MNRSQSLRSTLIWAFLATAIWGVVSIQTQDMPVKTALFLAPFFFAVLFFTMRLTNRIGDAIARRAAARAALNAPPPRAPLAPSTERPEHAQRRRQAEARRQRRGLRKRADR